MPPATNSEMSKIKYPCKNHNKFVSNISNSDSIDKSSADLVFHVFHNCGTSCIQFTIGAKTATLETINSIFMYEVLYKYA